MAAAKQKGPGDVSEAEKKAKKAPKAERPEVELVEIVENNFLEAFDLKLAPGQERFVSHPVRSLAQAYVYRDPDIPCSQSYG